VGDGAERAVATRLAALPQACLAEGAPPQLWNYERYDVP